MSHSQQFRHLKSSSPPLANIDEGLAQSSQRHAGVANYSPISWREYFDEKKAIAVCKERTFNVYTKGTDGPVLLLLHGGGYSGLTWALFTKCITASAECTVVSMDLRAHGDTVTDDDENVSLETLANDVVDVVKNLGLPKERKIVLIGHSMGGAVAIQVAQKGAVDSLSALVVIDVVEGSAMVALASMRSVLNSRPKRFESMEKAIEWCIRSHQVRNAESARVSMPGQLKQEAEGSGAVVWRTNLFKTEPYWSDWFTGMSEKFLAAPVPKLLILADLDRLDVTLTRAQMQGKFQAVILPRSGHCVHEDSPERVAETVNLFLTRFRLATKHPDA